MWDAELFMMVAAVLGGFAGVRIARRLEKAPVVRLVVTVGLAMSAIFFYRSHLGAR